MASPGDDSLERLTRHVQPLGPRVLVRILRAPDRTDSGLYLPAGAKENQQEALLGEVVEVARTLPKAQAALFADPDERDEMGLGQNVSGIPVESKVLFAKDRGITVPWDESLRILDVRHVLAVVDIISEAELQ